MYNQSHTNNLSRDWPHLLELGSSPSTPPAWNSKPRAFSFTSLLQPDKWAQKQTRKKRPDFSHSHRPSQSSRLVSVFPSFTASSVIWPVACRSQHLNTCQPACIFCTMIAVFKHRNAEITPVFQSLISGQFMVLRRVKFENQILVKVGYFWQSDVKGAISLNIAALY